MNGLVEVQKTLAVKYHGSKTRLRCDDQVSARIVLLGLGNSTYYQARSDCVVVEKKKKVRISCWIHQRQWVGYDVYPLSTVLCHASTPSPSFLRAGLINTSSKAILSRTGLVVWWYKSLCHSRPSGGSGAACEDGREQETDNVGAANYFW